MMVKVFQSNANGKIEFTRAELEKLLNEVYKKGYDTGTYDTKQNYWTWTSPSISSLRAPSVTYATNTTTSIDNLRCDNASKVATLESDTAKSATDALEAKKDNSYTISASSITPSPITVQLNNVGENPTNVNLAKSIDEIVNALLNSNPKAVKTGTISSERSDASTPHDRLARELRYL